jgi:Tfp pilus assembly PilM family ATPase
VQFEARSNLPFRLVEMAWDYQLLGEVEEQPELVTAADAVGRHGKSAKSPGARRRAAKPQRKQNMLLVAAKKVAVTRRLERLRQLGLHPDLVQCDCLALYNFWFHEYGGATAAEADFAPQKSPAGADGNSLPGGKSLVVLLDVGDDATNIILCSPGMVWFRTSGLGWFSFVRALVQQFKLTLGQADQWLRNPLKCPHPAKMYATLETQFENLVQEVQQTIELYQKDAQQHRVARMLLCGGGARLHGLLRYLCFGS